MTTSLRFIQRGSNMEPAGEVVIRRPDPPVVGKVNHHSIELYWDIGNVYRRTGPSNQWFKFSIEEEDVKTHMYGTIYSGYSKQHVVEGLESSSSYRFRLKVTGYDGECAYSPVVTVSTTREPMTGEHLHRAVNMNDEDAVLKVLESGIVQLLVNHGADINQETGSGKNSLMLACFAGHLDIVKYLREQGASWESRDKGGCTAMHWAVDGGDVKVIEWMIADGCQVDVKDSCSRWTPLMRVSAVTGKTDVARRLLAAGADVNVKDKDGKTPLMVAALNNHERLVRLLIEKGADCDITNEV
ncbi:hypothetical protein GDO81_003978 [Engystomops pustulosus]|uniref:Fibronectin type-III domain-containing protein n=1 Tax=Engystomops pustulosus TaxID=76066 RepID=A0AAV6ZP48_ENGPU|nr:hypothetical protein GDO81_003978 [Engystomops pustulosus]